MTRKAFVALLLMLFSVVSMKAQRFQVIDTDGDPVPYVAVTTEQGKLVGTTDIDGFLRIPRRIRSCACHKWHISHSR